MPRAEKTVRMQEMQPVLSSGKESYVVSLAVDTSFRAPGEEAEADQRAHG